MGSTLYWNRAFILVNFVPLCPDVPGFKGAYLLLPGLDQNV